MIKVASILPSAYLEKIPLSKKSGNIHLLLAHQVLKDSDYISYFLKRKKSGDYLILDNSAFEFGEALEDKKLLEAIEKCKPNEVILPDKLRDCETTLERSFKFIGCVERKFDVKFMAVAQGESLEEWVGCYRQFANHNKVHSIGLGAIYGANTLFGEPIGSQYLNGRVFLINFISIYGVVRTEKPHHLLGLGNSGNLELQMLKQLPWIRSCDSSAAYVQAVHGVRIRLSEDYMKIKEKIDFNAPFSEELLNAIKSNVEVLNKSGR